MPDPVITRPEYFVVNDIPSATPGWEHENLLDFRNIDQRGGDIPIPRGPTAPQQRRNTVTLRAVKMFVYGEFDMYGEPYDDPLEGLEANMDALLAGWVAPTGSSDGTRAIVWHKRTDDEVSDSCHVLGLPFTDQGGYMATGPLKLSFPNPLWTPVEP